MTTEEKTDLEKIKWRLDVARGWRIIILFPIIWTWLPWADDTILGAVRMLAVVAFAVACSVHHDTVATAALVRVSLSDEKEEDGHGF